MRPLNIILAHTVFCSMMLAMMPPVAFAAPPSVPAMHAVIDVPPLEVDGKEITFAYTDENVGESLIVKSAQATVSGLVGSTVYFSVTNISAASESVQLLAYVPGDIGAVESLSLRDGDTWKPIAITKTLQSDMQDQSAHSKRSTIPDRFTVAAISTGAAATIETGGTRYFRMALRFPPQSSGEYFIEATGDKGGYGLLDPWWDASWNYKKQINLSAATGAGTYYQVKLLIGESGGSSGYDFHLEGHGKSDFGDLRFTDNDEATELDYWIERISGTTPNQTATVWVEVQDDLDSPASMYAYYGKPGAATTANGSDAFLFFDDFTGTLSKWSRDKTSGVYPEIPGGQTYMRAGGGSTVSPYGHTSLGSSPTFTGFLNNAVRFRARVATNGIGEVAFRGSFSSNTGYKGRFDERSGQGNSLLKPAYNGWNFLAGAGADGVRPTADTWDIYELTAIGSNVNMLRNDTLVRSTTDISYSSAGEIALQNHYGSYTDYDWVLVRKLVATEPDFSSAGSEEIVTGDAIITTDGSQTAQLNFPSTNQYVGGAFTITEQSSSRNVTGITITENGTVNAQTNLANITLYYDLDISAPYNCASENYSGGEAQFGTTQSSFNGTNGTASFTDSEQITTTSTMCVYVVLDIGSGAANGETLEIAINDPSADVTVSTGSTGPDSGVAIGDTTTLLSPPDLQQIHYRWRNDDGEETANWLGVDWAYRKSHVFTSAAGAGTNYQMRIVAYYGSGTDSGDHVYLGSQANADFSDIRFTAADGETELDYWLQEKVDGNYAIFWVEVSEDLSIQDRTIYMYYRNPGATSTSNGSHTFEYFDSGDQTASWTINGTAGQSAGTGNPAPGYYATSVNGNYMYRNISLTPNRVVEFAMNSDGLGNFYFLTNAAGAGQHLRAETRSGNNSGIASATSWTAWAAPTACSNLATNTWYTMKLVIGSTTVQAYIDDVACGAAFTYSNNGGYIGFVGDALGSANTTWLDTIRVRKYTSPFPGHGVWGSQETADAGGTWAADEDTQFDDVAKNHIVRLRIEVSNEGGQTAANTEYRLEVSPANPTSCTDASYERISTNASWEMADSMFISDGDSSYNVVSGLTDENSIFTPGKRQDTTDQTGQMTLNSIQFTELEYAIRATGNASSGARYCFRVTNAGSPTGFTYAQYATATLAGVRKNDFQFIGF